MAALSALVAKMEMGKQKADGAVVQLGGLIGVMGREQAQREQTWRHQNEQLLTEAQAAGEKAAAMSHRVKEVEAAYRVRVAKHKKQVADLNLHLADLEAGRRDEQAMSRQLGLALVQLGKKADAGRRPMRCAASGCLTRPRSGKAGPGT